MKVLVDTSVWVDHFRHGNPVLASLLSTDQVLTHPYVLGEIACGTPPNRAMVLREIQRLKPIPAATVQDDVLPFIDMYRLQGMGCGLVDLSLLCSAIIAGGVTLWTLDKRLDALAQRFAVSYPRRVN